MFEEEKYFTVSYMSCCGESIPLTVIITDENSIETVYELVAENKVDYSAFESDITVSILAEGIIEVDSFDIEIANENASDTNEPTTDTSSDNDSQVGENHSTENTENPKQSGNNVAIILGAIVLALAIGGAVTYIIIKRKNNKNNKKSNKEIK